MSSKRRIRQHVASINTSISNLYERILALAEIYGENKYTIEAMMDSVFDEESTEDFGGRKQYIQYIVLMYIFTSKLEEVYRDLDVRS